MFSMDRVFGNIILIILLTSCGGGDTSVTADAVPDTISEGLRQVTVSSTGRVEVRAARVETYNDEDYTLFFQVKMNEFNEAGSVILEGEAERIELMGNGDGSASGGVRVRDLDDDSRLEAQSMTWDDAERLLTGSGEVQVELSDGLALSGDSFVADMARETYVFTDGVKGELRIDDE